MSRIIHTELHVEDELLTGAEEKGYTYLHCTFYASPKYIGGWWVNIYKTCYLVRANHGERIQMLDAINIPIAPDRHHLHSLNDYIKFTLIFPAVPKDWTLFHFYEESDGDGLKSYNISRNNTGVYNVVVK